MVELTAKSPLGGVLPVRAGKQLLEEVDPGTLTLLMPFKGQDKPLSEALKEAHGMTLPGPNRATGKDGARAIWFGQDQVLLAGPEPGAALNAYAAATLQSDAWTCVALSGPGAENVLAKLVPVDLRASVFKRGYTVRSLIGHMNGSITRVGADRFLLMVFRSMGATLAHELQEAMQTIAARD